MIAPDAPSDRPSESSHDPLRRLYAELDGEVAGHGPTCHLSGRCCRFEEHGHTLFVSAPEADYLLAYAPPPARLLDDGSTCPWQDHRGHCTARDARPLGCRLYYCDPTYQDALPELGERFIARLKSLVDDGGLRWDYAPLHRHLHAARDAGTYPSGPDKVEVNGQVSTILC